MGVAKGACPKRGRVLRPRPDAGPAMLPPHEAPPQPGPRAGQGLSLSRSCCSCLVRAVLLLVLLRCVCPALLRLEWRRKAFVEIRKGLLE